MLNIFLTVCNMLKGYLYLYVIMSNIQNSAIVREDQGETEDKIG